MPALHSSLGRGVGQGSTPDPHQLDHKLTAPNGGGSPLLYASKHLGHQPAKVRAGGGHVVCPLKHSLVGAIS